MFLALMHSKKKRSVYIQPLPVERASDFVHQNTKGIMQWFMCLMHWHYFVSVLTVEEKLLMVTGRASAWDLKICYQPFNWQTDLWNASDLYILQYSVFFLFPRDNFFCPLFTRTVSFLLFHFLMVIFLKHLFLMAIFSQIILSFFNRRHTCN